MGILGLLALLHLARVVDLQLNHTELVLHRIILVVQVVQVASLSVTIL